MKKLILIILITGLVVFGYSKTQNDDSNVSAGFVPGDVLYFLDTSWEWVQLNLLTFTSEGKVKLEIRYLNERMAEMEEIKRKGELTIEKTEKFIDDYNELAQKISENMEKIKSSKKDVDELILKIQNLSEKNRIFIKQATKGAPEKTAEFLNKTKNFGDELLNKF